MANFSSLQSKFMRMYESNPQYRMLSVDSAMAQMVQDGVLTKAEYDQLIKTSAFGFGFNADLGDSVEFGGTTSVENYQHSPSGGIVTSKDKPKFGQLNNVYIDIATLPINYQIIPGEYTILTGDSYVAFSYLSDIFEEGKTSFEQQRMNEGWVSDVINVWREWINAKATREEVNEKLADTRNDVELLNAAMRGALVDGNGNNVDFETAFEATRGVKYSKEKIELCQQKAETYAQADMFHTGLEDLISNLEKFSHGSSDLQYAKEFNKNALKTFQMLGITNQGKINEALAETSKAIGYEIKLIKQGTKGKDYYGQDYAIMFKNKDGKFVPLTPEISRIISEDLISKIDATKKALLGLQLDSSDKEVEEHLEQLKNDYEQSFKEAYGDKDISVLSEEYITAQQKGLMAVNLVANIGLIATSMLTGGTTAGLMTGLLMTQPLQALEMFTDENADTNLEAYGKMMLSQLPWMGAGMVMGKLGDLARSFVKLKGLQNLAANSGRSLDDLINIATNASKTGHKLPADLQKAMQITKRIANASGMSIEMALDYAVTKFVQPEGATTQDWIMSFVGALAGSSLNKNISDFTKTKDVRAVELQKAFPDLRLSAEEAGRIISKIDEMVADGSWQQAAQKGVDENGGKNLSLRSEEEGVEIRPSQKEMEIESGFQKVLQRKKDLDRMRHASGEEKFLLFLKTYAPKEYEKLQKLPFLIDDPKYKEFRADFEKFNKLQDTIDYCKEMNGSKVSDDLYEKYLQQEYVSLNLKTAEHIKNLCKQINKDFGVKVFLPSNLKEAGVALKLIYQELACYKMHAEANGQKAMLPATLEFFISDTVFMKDQGIQGVCTSLDEISIQLRGLNIETIKKCLRHELAHANDEKHLPVFPENFNPQKYEQIFRDANIPDNMIKYGQTSPKEFIAVAAEGDMSKYPPELREALKSLGMPEWMFNIPANFTKADIEKVAEINMKLAEREERSALSRILFKEIFGDSKDFSITSDLGFSTRGLSDNDFSLIARELCKRKDGATSSAAMELLEAIKNSELYNKAYDKNQSIIEDFETMTRDYEKNLYDDEMLGYAKEFIECIPKGKDYYLLISTEHIVRDIIETKLKYAQPYHKKEIIEATKKLMANPNVRNGVINKIIDACIEGNQTQGYTFNQNAFNTIYQLFDKKGKKGEEKYLIPNRGNMQDYSYSLMIAEIAQTAMHYEEMPDGTFVKYFDDLKFKIAMSMPESDPYEHYVHYNLTECKEHLEINLYNRSRSLQDFIVHNVEEKHFQREIQVEEYNTRSYKYETVTHYNQYADNLRELCLVNGQLDVQNCFAVDYMYENLHMSYSDIVKTIEKYKNKDGVLEMAMLRLIKNEKNGSKKYKILKQLDKLNQDADILYDQNGQVDQNAIKILKKSYNARSMTRMNEDYYSPNGKKFHYEFDISSHYMTDGKIDFKKLEIVEAELNEIIKRLNIEFNNILEHCAISNLYNLLKSNPEEAKKLLEMVEKAGIDVLKKASNNLGKGLDLELLNYYASMPRDLHGVLMNNFYWMHDALAGYVESINPWYLDNIKPEEKAVLQKYGIDFNFIQNAKKNKQLKKSEVHPQKQKQFEQILASCDQTLINADTNSGIQLEYTRAQFEKDILTSIENLQPARANDLLNFYGLSLNNGNIEGIFRLPQGDVPKAFEGAARKIEQCIDKFQNNRVINQNPEIKSLYTEIVKSFPEFTMLIGKTGKDGQRVDVTILKQLQDLVNNANYKTLSVNEKLMTKLAIILRGFSEIDSTPDVIEKHFTINNDGLAFDVCHKRYKNSDYAAAIIERFNLTEVEKYVLVDLVGHSGWSKEFETGIVDRQIASKEMIDKSNLATNITNNANRVAVNNRFGTLKLSKLIEDIINPDNKIETRIIEEAQNLVYQHMQVVNSVTAKDLKPYWETQIIQGVECQVIDLRKTKLPEDFYLMGHFAEYNVTELYDKLSNPNDKIFLSNSLIRANSAQTFAGRTTGIISEFDNRNVAEASRSNIDSGFGKSYNSFAETITGAGSRDIAYYVKEKLKLTNEEYGLLMEQIIHIRLNDLENYYKIGNKTLSKQEIIDAHNNAYEKLLKSQGEQSEVTILNQIPIAYTYSASRTWQGECPLDMTSTPLRRIIIFP